MATRQHLSPVASRTDERALLDVVVVGHVDHGKSTLIGRLLHDTGSLPDGKVAAVEAMCRSRGMPFEWSFVTDALQAERDQGITIDASHIRFSSAARDYVLIDAPGHGDFIANMVSGASNSDAALVVIDATEGVRDQSRRHGHLLHLLGVSQIAVAVTKMDLVDYSADRFAEIERDFSAVLAGHGITPAAIIPMSGRDGDNIVTRSKAMGWYRGPTVVEALDGFRPPAALDALPLRLPVQDVYKFDARRIIAGRIEAGSLRVGDEVLFSPSNRRSTVKSIEWFGALEPVLDAHAGQSVGLTLEEQIFVERGEVMSHVANPPIETTVFRARLFWLGRDPMIAGKDYTLRINTLETSVNVEAIEGVIDTASLSGLPEENVPRHAQADAILRARTMLPIDLANDSRRTGRFVLLDGDDFVAGGLIDMEGYPDQRNLITRKATNLSSVDHRVGHDVRAARNGHEGGVIWLTGLSGAGKTTLAMEVEKRLFEEGYQIVALDGDDVRHGLNANLGFSPQDRAENIRRIGEVAALFARTGMLVITAFISPYRADRDRARAAAGDAFDEIYIKADVETCEGRDPKGLYARARTGEIKDFTGISAPYEAPEACELVVDTKAQSVDESLATILNYVRRRYPLNRP